MKKFKKNISKTIFASFFVLQFVVSTAFMPLAANAQEVASEESSKEEVSEVQKEEAPEATEESVSLEEILIEDIKDLEEVAPLESTTVSDETVSDESAAPVKETESPVFQTVGVSSPVKVCKVIIDSEGNIVSDWSAYPGATFSTDLKFQGLDYSFDFSTSGEVVYADEYSFAAVCDTKEIAVDTSVEGLYFVKYNEEETSGPYSWVENYFEGDAQGETGLYNSLGGAMFAPFTSEDTAYDGQFELNGNPNTGFSATLFLVNEEIKTIDPSCDKDLNLISNGGFENPNVGGNWNIFQDGTSGLGWMVAWEGSAGNGSVANLEIHGGVAGWEASEGNQYAELDSDFDGPTGSIQNESASTRISQELNTVPGQTYEISFDFAARPGTDYADNRLGLYLDDVAWDTSLTRTNVDGTQPNWVTITRTFTAVKSTIIISFADLGTPNSFGTLLDNVSVKCIDGGPVDTNIPPKIVVNPLEVCLPLTATTYNFLAGVTGEDAEDGTIVATYTHNIIFGTAGTYTVNYTVTDSDGATATGSRTVFVKQNCGGEPEECPAIIRISENGREGMVKVTKVNPRWVPSISGTNAKWVWNNASIPVFPDRQDGGVFTVTESINIVGNPEESVIKIAADNVYSVVVNGNTVYGNPSVTPADIENIASTESKFSTVYTHTIPANLLNTGSNTIEIRAVNQKWAPVLTSANVDTNPAGLMYALTVNEDCDDDGGNGGGDEDEPTLTVPENSCIETNSVESINLLEGVSGTDSNGDALTAEDLQEIDIVITLPNDEVVTSIDFSEEQVYEVTYTFTDAFLNTVTVTRTITIDNDCDNGGGGGGGGGNGGGGSSSGSRRNSDGEVLGATSCVAFTTYNRSGNTGGEIKALQTFLNLYMNAGLTVDGVYGATTVQAVHDFQAFHWKEVIDPWTPPLSPNTTGWQYKTTRMTINAIIDCPEAPVYLEDPGVMYQVLEVTDQNELTASELETIYNLLAEAQSGNVLGASSVNSTDYSNPNFDLMFGK